MIEHTDSLDVPRTVEGPSLSAERQEYLLKVQKIVDLLESSELKGKWWMIGGIAKDAYTGNIDFRIGKPDHPRDVDILVKEGDIRAFERVRAQNTTNIPIGGFLNRFVHVGAENSFLHFGATKIQVPTDVFATKEVNLFGVKFPTLPPETLFHLYCLRRRERMRPKDFTSALKIGRFIQNNPSPDLPEESFQNFHRFSRQVRRPSLHPQVIMSELPKWYRATKLGKVLPLRDPVIRSMVLHIWDAAGLLGKRETPQTGSPD